MAHIGDPFDRIAAPSMTISRPFRRAWRPFPDGRNWGSGPRAVQCLLQGLVVEDGVEAEGSVPEGLGDVCCAVVAEDVEGEASGAGHDAGVVADSATIFVT